MFYEQLKFFIDNFVIIQKLVPTIQEGFDSKWERKSKFEQFYDTLFIAVTRDDKPGPFCQARASGTGKFPSPG